MTDSQKTEAELLASLPLLVKDIVEHSNWRSQLRKIVTERHFRVDQGAFLESVVLKFIVGETSAEEMASSVADEFKLDSDNLQSLFAQLDREIFSPMKVELETKLAEDDILDTIPPEVSAPILKTPTKPSTMPAVSVPASKLGPAPAGSDDLEALINAGDDLLSAPKNTPIVPPTTPTPIKVEERTIDPFASVGEKLSAPVIKPAEVSSSIPNKQTSINTPSTDPYREPIK